MPKLTIHLVAAGQGFQMLEESSTLAEGTALLAAATADERAHPRYGREPEDGEVRVFLLEDGTDDVVLAGPVCFLRGDSADALAQYFDVPAKQTEKCVAIAVTLGELIREGQPPAVIDQLLDKINAHNE